MPQTETVPAPPASSFASLLSSLTSPPEQPADLWDDSALADDVATISCERALQAHTDKRPSTVVEPRSSQAHCTKDSTSRTSIVTLRLTMAESTQLRKRAADAGLTVSSYLRSCVFEVESLRAQVREALAQFRSAVPSDLQVAADPPRATSQTWRSRLLPRWLTTERSAGA